MGLNRLSPLDGNYSFRILVVGQQLKVIKLDAVKKANHSCLVVLSSLPGIVIPHPQLLCVHTKQARQVCRITGILLGRCLWIRDLYYLSIINGRNICTPWLDRGSVMMYPRALR